MIEILLVNVWLHKHLVIYEPNRRIRELERRIQEMEMEMNKAYNQLKHQLAAYEFAMEIDGAADINNRHSTSKLGTLKRTDL